MSVACPKGHASESTDYCDVCGARIEGEPAQGSGDPAAAGGADLGEPDPGNVPPTPGDPSPYAEGSPGTSPKPCPSCGTSNAAANKFCEDCGFNFDTGTPSAPQPESGWEAIAAADRTYYDKLDSDGIDFPAFYLDRRFALRGERMCIGRRSVSQGIVPEIDLGGAPEDIGVSHQHAFLAGRSDGGWSLVDPGSTNGTFLNDSPDPVPVNDPILLHDGDRIHLGAWTTITVKRVSGTGSPPPSGGSPPSTP